VLESVARYGLLVVLGVVANFKGSCPRDAGEIKDPGIFTSDISQ
jgi:hypothetical protein